MSEAVQYQVANRVATITINRPEARNALSSAVREQLSTAFMRAKVDDEVDVLILTGTDPAFCAGLDLKELEVDDSDLLDPFAMSPTSRPLKGAIPGIDKPIIGAVNGVAITGGLELALGCDFLIASEFAQFADTHTRVGVQPGWGLTVLLPEAVGLRRAKEMSATGNFVDAEKAFMWGLVNQVVAHEELLPRCHALAQDIVSNDQSGIRRLYATYDEGSLLSRAEAWQLEERVSQEWLNSGLGESADIGARRGRIMERGQAQKASRPLPGGSDRPHK